MKPIIEAVNISKRYTIGHRASYGSLREEIMQAVTSPFRRFFSGEAPGYSDGDSIWALKGVSFEVKEGSAVGIIGRNGAGKSTLLKILSRITEPTAGRVVMRGRVASLLEVGTGFHPELTGRENIFLNGSLLGMSNREIRAKFDEIVAFSEIEKFLDTPVKRYSSGMYVRLAFAVAAHLEPEILVIDEVLAVGDAAFQKKCLGKMGDVAKGGQTILFVSHNMGAVKSLCDSAILLSQGGVVMQGKVVDVAEAYLTSVSREAPATGEVRWPDRKTAPGGDEVRLVSIRLLDESDTVKGNFDAAKPVKIEVTYELFENLMNIGVVLQLINSEGHIEFTSSSNPKPNEERKAGIYRTVCTIPGGLLNSGHHFVKLYVDYPGVKYYVEGREFIEFHAERTFQHGSVYLDKIPGVVAPKLEWETEALAESV